MPGIRSFLTDDHRVCDHSFAKMEEALSSGHPDRARCRIYLSHREQSRDLAIAILVDVSLSTEAWVEDRRVIDVEKEALLALVHGLAACGDEFAVYTFTSQRRH